MVVPFFWLSLYHGRQILIIAYINVRRKLRFIFHLGPQLEQDPAPLPLYLPVPQVVHFDAAAPEYVPAAHELHVAADVLEYLPAPHAMQSLDAFLPVLG